MRTKTIFDFALGVSMMAVTSSCTPTAPQRATATAVSPAPMTQVEPSVGASPAAGPIAASAVPPGSELSGYRWEFPCKEPMPAEPPSPTGNVDCTSTHATGDPMKTDNFTTTKSFGGEAGKTYDVTLRFRGVVEPMTYKDGAKDGDYFYIGGAPVHEAYNIYKLEISSPKSHFYLNRQDAVGHKIFTIDYTKTLKIDGGASIVFSGDGQNGLMISNFKKLTVPEIAPAPYNGQFIQVDVVGVTEAK